MANNGIDLSGKTPEELDAIIEAAKQAKESKRAASTIALIGAFEASLKALQERLGDTHPKLTEIKQPWIPKPSNIARKNDMSETEMHNALEKGRKMIAGL